MRNYAKWDLLEPNKLCRTPPSPLTKYICLIQTESNFVAAYHNNDVKTVGKGKKTKRWHSRKQRDLHKLDLGERRLWPRCRLHTAEGPSSPVQLKKTKKQNRPLSLQKHQKIRRTKNELKKKETNVTPFHSDSSGSSRTGLCGSNSGNQQGFYFYYNSNAAFAI